MGETSNFFASYGRITSVIGLVLTAIVAVIVISVGIFSMLHGHVAAGWACIGIALFIVAIAYLRYYLTKKYKKFAIVSGGASLASSIWSVTSHV